jgi:hypothetical protein
LFCNNARPLFLRGAVSIFKRSPGLAMVARFLFKFLASEVSIFVITIIPAIAALSYDLANS